MVVVELLGVVLAVVALAQRHKEVAVTGLGNAAAKVQRALHLGPLAEDDAHVLQAAGICRQGGARHRRAVARRATRCRLGKTEIDTAGAGKIVVGHHVQQTALPARCHRRHPCQRRPHLPRCADHAQAPRALSHQKLPAGQKGHRPGMHQTGGDRHQRHRWRRDGRILGMGAGLYARYYQK